MTKSITYTKTAIGAVLVAVTALSFALITPTQASNGDYRVTIQNISNAIVTPPVVALSKKNNAQFFTIGEASSVALEMLAEGGDTSGLVADFEENSRTSVVAHDAPLMPGASVELNLSGQGSGYLYVAGMLLPTNDAFVALNGERIRGGKKTQVFYASSYDAGTEANTEADGTIPGPFGGEGFNEDRDDVDFIHPHPGLHGQGDIDATEFNWEGPVLKITVERI